jgi:hypothetical protein
MLSATPIKMPERWSELSDSSPNATFKDINSILGISIVPEDAFGTFKNHGSSVEEFAAIDEESAGLIVDDLTAKHPTAFTSPVKRRLLLKNLLTLVDFKNAGGNTAARPLPAKIMFYIDSASKPVSFQERLRGASHLRTSLLPIRNWSMVLNWPLPSHITMAKTERNGLIGRKQ